MYEVRRAMLNWKCVKEGIGGRSETCGYMCGYGAFLDRQLALDPRIPTSATSDNLKAAARHPPQDKTRDVDASKDGGALCRMRYSFT